MNLAGEPPQKQNSTFPKANMVTENRPSQNRKGQLFFQPFIFGTYVSDQGEYMTLK